MKMKSIALAAVMMLGAAAPAYPHYALGHDGHSKSKPQTPERVPVESSASDIRYAPVSKGIKRLQGGPLLVDVLVDAGVLGSAEVEIAEITFPAGYNGTGHAHGRTEIFYVVSGNLGHQVAGQSYEVGPGEVAIARAGDEVQHAALDGKPVKLLAIWTPAGELNDLVEKFGFRPQSGGGK